MFVLGRAFPPPRLGETSPTHTSGARGDWEGPREALPSIGIAGSAPALCQGDPHRFPDPPVRGTRHAADGAISAHPDLRVGGEGGGRGRWKRPRMTMGAPIAIRGSGGGWERRGY